MSHTCPIFFLEGFLWRSNRLIYCSLYPDILQASFTEI